MNAPDEDAHARMGDQGEPAAKMSQFGQNCNPREPAAAAALIEMTAASSGRSAQMGEREKLLDKLGRYLTIRDLISDEPAIAVIEELIRETEERLTQIDSNAPDQPV